MKEPKQLPANCLVFDGCDRDLIEKLEEDVRCRRIFYEKGELVSFEGGALGILQKGRIAVSALREGQELILNFHEKGAVFGFSSLFEGEKHPFCTSMKAKTGVEVLWIEEALLSELMAKEPQIARNIIAHQATKIRFLNEKILSLTCPTAEERLFRHLERLPQGENGAIVVPVRMSQLAKRLNISRASVYRALDKLIEEGKIQKSGNTLSIKKQ